MFKDQFNYLKTYFAIAEPNPWLFALNIFTAVLYKAANITRPFVAALIIKALTESDARMTYLYIAIYTGIYLFYRAMLFFNWRISTWNLIDVYDNIQDKIFNKLISVDHDFTQKVNRGKLLNVINSDLFEVGNINSNITEFFTATTQIVFIVIICLTNNVPVAIIMILSAISVSHIRTKHDKKFNFYWWKSQIENDKFSDFLNQVLNGLQEVKVFNMLPSLHKQLDRIQKRYDKAYTSQRRHRTIRDSDVKYSVYIFRAIILLVCVIFMATGHMELDIMVLLYSYHQQLIDTTFDLTDATTTLRLDKASVERIKSILNYKAGASVKIGNLNLDQISGSIKFKNVSLNINKHKVLKDLNFKIRPHEFVAIVGHPGAGKTKLFDLILRLISPTKGKITLDDININEFSREVFTSNVAVANQAPFIFNTSIRKNLSFVDPDIKHQIEACKTAGIHNFIETLPMGYNTILRENAGNISGGQRQMISIARTIVTDAEILLLDDITTSLDPDTAKLVPRLIDRIKNNRTVIMITKKPELMKSADRIIVLDKGKISDIGTHEKLLERNSIYRSLQAMRSSNSQEEGA